MVQLNGVLGVNAKRKIFERFRQVVDDVNEICLNTFVDKLR